MLRTNLEKVAYARRSIVTATIDTLCKNADESSAYELSLPLLASALQGDDDTYRKILPNIKKAIKSTDKNSLAVWMWGRVLQAADCLGDTRTAEDAQTEMMHLFNDKDTAQDALTAWAWSYLANHSTEMYQKVEKNILFSATELTVQYKTYRAELNTSNESKMSDKEKANLQELLSNALYGWIMAAQAGASAQQETAFDTFVENILSITGKKSLGDALSTGLLRTAKSNDYPAWGLAIMSLACVTLGKLKLFADLEKPLANAIAAAKEAKHDAEFVLAETNAELAIARSEDLSMKASLQASSKSEEKLRM